jgi:hypothetical protein
MPRLKTEPKRWLPLWINIKTIRCLISADFYETSTERRCAKILSQVIGGKKEKVQNNLAKQTGLQSGQVSGLLTQLAPMLLGALGNQKKRRQSGANGIAGLLPSLGSLLGGPIQAALSGIASLLDADKDGNIMDDLKGLWASS